MDSILIGSKKHGCLIDNNKRILVYFENISLFEKIKHKKKQTSLNYSDIQFIKICYGIMTGPRFDSAQITLEVHTSDNELYDMRISYSHDITSELKEFVHLLLTSGLEIKDPHNLLNQILSTDISLLDLIKKVSKTK